MNFLLAIDPNNKNMSFGDKISFGGSTLLLGMATVFSVLIIIWISLIVLKFFLHDVPAAKEAQKNAAPAPTVEAPVVKTASDDEIVAVIAAAIAMAESESSGLKFRVVSFRRK